MNPSTLWIGGFEITRLVDGQFEAPIEVLTHIDGAEATHRLRESWPDPVFRVDVNCFALRSAEGVMLVDAGTGPSWGDALGHAPEKMREAGMSPDQVTRVLLTHLHGDHALGLLDGDGAVFPLAEVLVPEGELVRFTDPVARAAAPDDELEVFWIAEQIVTAYAGRVRTIAPGTILLGIEAVPLPGHTRDHVGYLIQDGTAGLLLCGDMLRAVQTAIDPGAGLIYDEDPKTAAQTRRHWLARAAEGGWLLSGGHVPGLCRSETG